jgi:NitT/TauT family transport system permease protein
MRDARGRFELPVRAVWLLRLAVLGGVLLGWHLASGTLLPAFYISSPGKVLDVLMRWLSDGSIWKHIAATVSVLFTGYALGAIIGIAIGLWLGLNPRAERLVQPFIAALFGLPKIALLPLLVIAFGIGFTSKVVLVASVVVFLLLFATLAGVRDIDRDMVEGLRLMGATEAELTRKVRMPAILPWIYTGMRTAIGYALTTTVVSEALQSNRGLGYLIEHSAVTFNAAGVFAAVAVLLVLSTAIMLPLGAMEARLKPTRL